MATIAGGRRPIARDRPRQAAGGARQRAALCCSQLSYVQNRAWTGRVTSSRELYSTFEAWSLVENDVRDCAEGLLTGLRYSIPIRYLSATRRKTGVCIAARIDDVPESAPRSVVVN